jgi:hypothetical protein
LVNVIDTWSKIDTGGLHRKKDPGAGAITPFHDRKSRATRQIQAGEELYIDYGENYFESRTSTYGLMPLNRHYALADKLVRRYMDIRRQVFRRTQKHSRGELEADLWELIKGWGFESRTLNALPRNHSTIEEVMKNGGTAWQNYQRSIRDMDWLKKYGQCMDNIRPGRSTVPQAGRGAFATRPLPKGTVIAPAPLIHIADKKELIMYDVLPENDDGLIHRNASKPIHHQLLINYCFGHRNSTLLLSPYGYLTSLINHSPNGQANARIVWTSQKMRNPEWIQKDPQEFATESHSGLQFDFVATRDIEANEEVLIDYGKEWEDAWKDHVENWNAPENADNYNTGYELERMLDLEVRTVEEGGMGEHIKSYCHETYRRINGLKPSKNDYHSCRAIKRYKTSEGETRYLVELFSREEDEDISFLEVSEILFDIPRDAFLFEDAPYTRDHQMPWSFRHEMMIPDDMFPKAWMNLK